MPTKKTKKTRKSRKALARRAAPKKTEGGGWGAIKGRVFDVLTGIAIGACVSKGGRLGEVMAIVDERVRR